MTNWLEVDDPYSGEVAYRAPYATWEEVERVLDRARAAAEVVRCTALSARIAWCEAAVAGMEKRCDEIAADISRVMGKPLGQARSEVAGMALRARYMISIAESSLADVVPRVEAGIVRRIRKEPLGVVLDLPAWNYPLLTAVNVVIPAVLAGNSVIVKHSPRSPMCGEHFARAFRDAGAAPDVVQALDCTHEISERMVGDARVDHVVFTGSNHGGHRIVQAAANRFMHVGLELGGNDPSYIAPDCDLDKTIDNIVDGAMYNAGQSCCAVERVYVHRSVYARAIEKCEMLVRAYTIGDPRTETTTLGPVAQPHHPEELAALVDDAVRNGAKLIAGGKRTTHQGRGRFFEATLLGDAPQSARLMKSESFGPILPLSPVDSDEEALAKMNDSSLGLTASIWTEDEKRAERFARDLKAGTVFMNRCDHVDPSLPWNGWKDSGRGHSLSLLGFDQLTRPKGIHFRKFS